LKADTGLLAGRSPERSSRKAATRQRVLDAARELFDTHGYQGTTIREIARHAGVSVGSVFTTFASKGEILSEVMSARLGPLVGELNQVMAHLRGSTADRLRTLFAIHFEFECRQTRLFLSHIAAAFDWTLPVTARAFGRTPQLVQIVRACLQQGVEAGDIRADLDLDEAVQLLVAAYAWTYRLALQEEMDVQALIAVMDRQIGLAVDGFAAR